MSDFCLQYCALYKEISELYVEYLDIYNQIPKPVTSSQLHQIKSKIEIANQIKVDLKSKITNIHKFLENKFEYIFRYKFRQDLAGQGNYAYVGKFSDGLALAVDKFDWKNTVFDRYHFIDENGQKILSNFYESKSFSDGLTVVEMSFPYKTYIDRSGKNVINRNFMQAQSFSEGLGCVRDMYSKQSFQSGSFFIDLQGQIMEKIGFFDDARSFSEGLAAVEKNNCWFFIDKNGVKQTHLGDYRNAGSFGNSLAPVSIGPSEWFYIDHRGQRQLGPFCEAGDFALGTAPIKNPDSDEIIFINTSGETIQALGKWDKAKPFNSDGVAKVGTLEYNGSDSGWDEEEEEDNEEEEWIVQWQYIDRYGKKIF